MSGCPDNLPPAGDVCPRCGNPRGPSGVDGGSWVHYPEEMIEGEWRRREVVAERTRRRALRDALCIRIEGQTLRSMMMGWMDLIEEGASLAPKGEGFPWSAEDAFRARARYAVAEMQRILKEGA